MKITYVDTVEDLNEFQDRAGVIGVFRSQYDPVQLEKASEALKAGGWADKDFEEIVSTKDEKVFVGLYSDDTDFKRADFSNFANSAHVRMVLLKIGMQIDLWPAHITHPLPHHQQMPQ